MTERLKKQILDSFPSRDRKMVKSFPNIDVISESPICWIDSSTRYGYLLLNIIDPIDLVQKNIGILFNPPDTSILGPHKICDLCLTTQYSKDVSFWTTRNRINKLKVHGFYFCTDLKCLNFLEGKTKKTLPPVPIQENLSMEEKIARYYKNLNKFLEIISSN